MPHMAETRTTTAESGVRISYEVEGTGPPVVLLHGITESRRAWDDFVPALRDSFQVIRLDLRGHGESDKGESYGPLELASDVRAVVDALDVGAPHVVGHSLGGMVATGYAALFPVRSVLNVDQPLQLGDFLHLVRELEPALRGDGFVDAMNLAMEALAGDALPDRAKSRLRAFRESAHQDVVLALWEPLFTQSPEQLSEAVEALLPNVTAPYLSLHGTDLGAAYEDWLTGLVPRATVETWDGLGHWLHLVEPERFVARVRTFTATADTSS
jgi:pimeloyl-ACP methyl ester carboxylesterase